MEIVAIVAKLKWHYLIYLFVEFIYLRSLCISVSIYYLLMELFICNIYWYQLYLSSYLFKDDLTTCDNYLFKEIMLYLLDKWLLSIYEIIRHQWKTIIDFYIVQYYRINIVSNKWYIYIFILYLIIYYYELRIIFHNKRN